MWCVAEDSADFADVAAHLVEDLRLLGRRVELLALSADVVVDLDVQGVADGAGPPSMTTSSPARHCTVRFRAAAQEISADGLSTAVRWR